MARRCKQRQEHAAAKQHDTTRETYSGRGARRVVAKSQSMNIESKQVVGGGRATEWAAMAWRSKRGGGDLQPSDSRPPPWGHPGGMSDATLERDGNV